MADLEKIIQEQLRKIAGWPKRPLYAGGKDGSSQLATALTDLLLDADWKVLGSEQRDHISRICSATMAAIRRGWMGEKYRSKPWHAGPGQPCVERRTYGWDFYPTDDVPLDHISILVDRQTKEKTFVSEPYGITSKGIKGLAKLVEAGWDVSIDAVLSAHFPGDTVAVLLSKPKIEEVVHEVHDRDSGNP